MITVGLLWHSLSSGNLGVGALTESNIAIVRELAESQGKTVRFLVLGSGAATLPALAEELELSGHVLEVCKVRVFREAFRQQIRQCDLVIDIGEGDSFADIYGFKRFFYYWLSKYIVLKIGRPLVLAPQTIGPFDGMTARFLAKQVMKKCAKVFARDHISREYLSVLGITNNALEAIDVAVRLPFLKKEMTTGARTRVGVNVSALLYHGGYTGHNQFGLNLSYKTTVEKILDWFTAQPDIEVHLVAHVIEPAMPIEDDFALVQRLGVAFPTAKIAPKFERPSEAKTYIASMDFFVGARMHACIAAISSGVPVVPMAYSRKFNGLFGTLKYSHLVDCKIDTDEIALAKIVAAYKDRHILEGDVAQSATHMNSALKKYSTVLDQLLKNVPIRAS